MAGEKILARTADNPNPNPTQVLVGWALSAPVVSSVDGLIYQAGKDLVAIAITDDSQAIMQKIRNGIAARISEVTGGTYTAADVRGFQAVRTGTVTISALETSHDVVFSIPMPSASYKVTVFPRNLALTLDITNQTANGFTFTFSLGNSGDLDFVAVEVTT